MWGRNFRISIDYCAILRRVFVCVQNSDASHRNWKQIVALPGTNLPECWHQMLVLMFRIGASFRAWLPPSVCLTLINIISLCGWHLFIDQPLRKYQLSSSSTPGFPTLVEVNLRDSAQCQLSSSAFTRIGTQQPAETQCYTISSKPTEVDNCYSLVMFFHSLLLILPLGLVRACAPSKPTLPQPSPGATMSNDYFAYWMLK